ncbi:MAG: HNH endonuclease domain-containing protein [Bacteroidia bacterium]
MANFSETQIQTAWDRATSVANYDPTKYKQDPCGAWIQRDHYGNPDHVFGWEIDHAYPVSKGGDDSPQNIRAMHCKNNRSKADDYPYYTCAIISMDNTNIESSKEMKIHDDLQNILKQKYPIP